MTHLAFIFRAQICVVCIYLLTDSMSDGSDVCARHVAKLRQLVQTLERVHYKLDVMYGEVMHDAIIDVLLQTIRQKLLVLFDLTQPR